MFLTIFSIILVVAAYVGIVVLNTKIDEYNKKIDGRKYGYEGKEKIDVKVSKWYSLIPLVLILFAVISIVPTGVVGVKTAWGKVTGSVSEGLVFKAPWESVYQISTKVQKVNRSEMEGSTKDLQMISGINVDINYQVEPEKVVDLYSRVGVDFADVVIAPAVTQSVKSQIAQYDAEKLANSRGEVADSMTTSLNEALNGYGIKVVSVALNNFDFSKEYSDAIESKAVALQETQAAQQRLEKAKVEAEQKVVEANAQSEANRLLQSTLNEYVLKEQFIKKWNGALPQVMGSDSIISTDLLK